MIRNDFEIVKKNYDELFNSNEIKARAFDKIAENYYFGNFGTMQKSDIDVLMFSIYIEEILNCSEENLSSYSDYTLAKQLGITQSKISNLKVKKQLQYPYDKFDWKQSFKRVCKNARSENGKIYINLRDKNLYYELKNQIDEHGGYIETSLTTNLLIISPTDFLMLVEQIMTDEEMTVLKKLLREKYNDDVSLNEELTKAPISKALKNRFADSAMDVICEVAKDLVPIPMNIGLEILKTVVASINHN